ncbi:MAG: aromatic amino acid lyase [Microbacterium sp.]
MTATSMGTALAAATGERVDTTPDLARKTISAERMAVEEFLARGGHAYGFTTRLGHLDDDAADAEAAEGFLADHLVGETFAIDAAAVRLMTTVKLAQLGHGGSGISVSLFDALRDHLTTAGDAVEGAWLSSYGAGDVVPAAWWLRAVISGTDVRLARGDFIAAVNGNFISTAVAILAAVRAVDAFAEYLAMLPPRPDGARAPRSSAAREVLEVLPPRAAGDRTNVQSAVSGRDSTPFVTAVASSIAAAASAIEDRLDGPSANPLLHLAGGEARFTSQNGFLDFGVTTAMAGIGQTAVMAVGHVQRLVEARAQAEGSSALVQAPKIAEALVVRAAAQAAPRRFSGALSQGVEDMFDASLIGAVSALHSTALLEEALRIARMAGVTAVADPQAVRSVLARSCGVEEIPIGLAERLSAPLLLH